MGSLGGSKGMMSEEGQELWQRVKELSLSDRLWFQVLLASSVHRTIEGPKWEAETAAKAVALGLDPKEILGLLNQDDYLPGENPFPDQTPSRSRPPKPISSV